MYTHSIACLPPFRQVILIDLLSFVKPNRGKYRPCSSALYSLTLCFDATFTLILCQEGWHRPALSLFAKVFCVFSCILPKVAYFQKFAFAKRSGAMKTPVGLLSDRTVLRSKMEGSRPDKFTLTRPGFCGNLSQQFNIYIFLLIRSVPAGLGNSPF